MPIPTVFSLDATILARQSNLTGLTSGDTLDVIVNVYGFLPSDTQVQWIFTAKVSATDADNAATTVQKTITPGAVIPCIQSLTTTAMQGHFVLSQIDTAKLVNCTEYDVRVFIQRAGVSYDRTVIRGTLSAAIGATGVGILFSGAASMALGPFGVAGVGAVYTSYAAYLAGALLGGDSAFYLWNRASGLTVNGSSQVTAWTDQRGNLGFGPTLANFGTGPLLVGDAITGYLDFAGGAALFAGGFAGFSQASPISFVYVGTNIHTSGIVADLSAPISTDADMQVTSGGGGFGTPSTQFSPGATWIQSSQIRYASARLRVFLSSRNGLVGRVQAAPLPAATAAISSGANLGNGDRLFVNANGSPANEKLRSLIVLKRDYSAADLSAILTGAQIFDKSVSDGPKFVTFEGDSHQDTRNLFAVAYPVKIMEKATFAAYDDADVAVNSSRIVYDGGALDITARYLTNVKPFYKASRSKNILVFDAGTNDLAIDLPSFPDGNAGGAIVFTRLLNYCAQAKADGFTVVVAKILPRATGTNQTYFDAAIAYVNSHIDSQANPPWSLVLDWSANIVQTSGSTPWITYPTYWDGPGVHLSDLGTQLQADYAAPLIAAL